ncbi:BadF/BadG/BcrA/BcrD ATPase family protein [Abyssibius alkaniclasticus]|uniref:BadF/BadG/BcrA/BcrD ATPase family protein n=1 Tax=Abyssibius alkaniclasticus TaxID=2881234 RepID=UPI004058E03C
MRYLLGVDGGGTGCRVAIADMHGAVLAECRGGAANIATNYTQARANIIAACAEAVAAAGLPEGALGQCHAVLGLAGSNLGDYAARLGADLPFAANEIVNDSIITLEGAIGGVEGCIAAIGTGSVFAARDAHGVHMLGGWGFLLGDDGSGARLGKDILHLTVLAHDGVRPHSPLTADLLAEFSNRPDVIVETAKTWSPGDFGKLAPRVVEAWRQGDAHATAVLGHHADLVQDSLDALGFSPDKAFCMLGGLGHVYLELLDPKYQAAAQPPKGNALSGAVALAHRQFGAT